MRTATNRHRLAATTGALTLLLAACGTDGDEQAEPSPTVAPDAEPDDDDGTAQPDATEEPDDGESADDPDAGEEPGSSDEEPGAVEPLAGEPTTGPDEGEGEFGTLAVTEVRVATHDGFDRIVFETEGDGVPGWFVDYGEATSQGSGEPADVEGEVTLRVAIDMVTLPPDLPEDLEAWMEDLDGPAGGVVDEVVHDTIYEGIHLFFVGLDAEHPFVVERFEDPDRIVVDVFHDG